MTGLRTDVQETIKARLATSTRLAYKGMFTKYLKFCGTSSPGNRENILNFLQEALNQRLSLSAIKMRHAACLYFLSRAGFPKLLDDRIIQDFMRGTKRLAPIPVKKLTTWDPGVVLRYIRSRERPDLYLNLARETITLLLLATGLRVDDAWKLGANWQVIPMGIRIPFRMLRKCDVTGHVTPHFDLPAFTDARLCPVEALKALRRQEERKGMCPALFVTSLGKRATKGTLRSWTIKFLGQAGICATAGSCRTSSTSAAWAAGVSIDGIMKSAGWRSADTFRRYYKRPVDTPAQVLFRNHLQ